MPCRVTWGLHSGAESAASGAVRGGLFGVTRVRSPLVLVGGCDWLIWRVLEAGREMQPTAQRHAGAALRLCPRSTVWLEVIIPQSRLGRGSRMSAVS